MYKLELIHHNELVQLKLSRSTSMIRTWFGKFAQIIYNKILLNNQDSNTNTVYLRKNQIHALFTEITCLHQTLIFQNKIDSDLIKCNIPSNCFNIAESLLLQIRINSIHPSFDDLQAYFLDEFKHFDILLFNQTINLLIGNTLIQSIITEDGQQFFDKNTQPHDHIYFKKQKKLVDCSKEIADFLSLKKNLQNPKHTNPNIFNVNTNLSNVLIDNDSHLH